MLFLFLHESGWEIEGETSFDVVAESPEPHKAHGQYDKGHDGHADVQHSHSWSKSIRCFHFQLQGQYLWIYKNITAMLIISKSGGTVYLVDGVIKTKYTYKTNAFESINGRAEEQGYLRPMGHGRSWVKGW